MIIEFGKGIRGHKPRSERPVGGILHGHRFEIIKWERHMSSTNIAVYQV
jgi:hypothetical protein